MSTVARTEPTGRANARPMTGSAKQSSFSSAERKLDCFVASAPRNDEEGVSTARYTSTNLPDGQISRKPVQSHLQNYSASMAENSSMTRTHRSAGMRRCIQPSLRGALGTKQSSFGAGKKEAGLLRFARNDGFHNERAAFSVVIVREGGRSSIPETLVIEPKGRSVLDTAFAGYDDCQLLTTPPSHNSPRAPQPWHHRKDC